NKDLKMSYTDTGRIVKMEVDYEAAVNEKLPICEKLQKDGKLSEALDILLSLEKQTRTAADTHSTSRVLVAIVKLCFESQDMAALRENILVLSKRRGQIKQSVTKMIQECCSYVDKIKDPEVQLEYIDTLRTVTAGKIYVEVERARLTHKLSIMKEKEGKIVEAAGIMQELQVETYGSMDRKEKVELILEQMRLCLLKEDYVRTQIISKKITPKFFDDPATAELKLKYNNLMIQLDKHEGSYLAICKHYQAIYNTASLPEDQKLSALRHMILYLLLAPFDNEQSDLTHRTLTDRSLDQMPLYKELIKYFTTMELISWSSMSSLYEAQLRDSTPETDVFLRNPEGEKRWNDFKSRIVEHNIRTMEKYYQRVTTTRMAELLDLTVPMTEKVLSEMVVAGTIWAKIDRLAGIICFARQKDPNTLLNDWSHNLNALMQLVSKTTHLINKEEMVHKHLHATSATTDAAA
ncbi:PSMD12, partial [Cordylochernes scorpioides]